MIECGCTTQKKCTNPNSFMSFSCKNRHGVIDRQIKFIYYIIYKRQKLLTFNLTENTFQCMTASLVVNKNNNFSTRGQKRRKSTKIDENRRKSTKIDESRRKSTKVDKDRLSVQKLTRTNFINLIWLVLYGPSLSA